MWRGVLVLCVQRSITRGSIKRNNEIDDIAEYLADFVRRGAEHRCLCRHSPGWLFHSKSSMKSAKPPGLGAVSTITLEFVVSAFYVSAPIANITSVKMRDHRQETFSVYTVAAPCIVPICFHGDSWSPGVTGTLILLAISTRSTRAAYSLVRSS